MRCLLLCLVLGLSTTLAASHDVLTSNGVVTGKSVTVDGREIVEFIGIPFAKPPLGKLRFQPPQALDEQWSSPLIADKPPKGCQQPPSPFLMWPEHLQPTYGEDCLFLHVWSPSVSTSAQKSVMVWIHGGGFVMGEGLPMYNGTALSSIGDVVVVTIQYRLGFLGFARFDSELVPGNIGLLDQQMALKWVKENIAGFGGNPDSVTIFGESAGSASVSLHLVNEESGKYFHRAIMQSGTFSNAWAVNENLDALEKLNRDSAAKYLSCSQEDAAELLLCLQGKTEAEISEAIQNFFADHPFGPTQGPVIDGHFLSQSPQEIMASGKILKKETIVGVMEREGDLFTIFSLMGAAAAVNSTDPDITKFADEAFINSSVSMMFQYFPAYPHKISPVASEMIRLRSLSHVDPKRTDLNAARMSQVMGEYLIDCQVNAFVDAARKVHDNVYFYQIVHKIHQPLLPVLTHAPEWMKATHGDDIALVFALPIVFPDMKKKEEEEMHLTRRIIADFTTFAKTGAPQDPNWRPYSLEKKEFYRYDIRSSLETGGVKRDDCVFWDKVLPMVSAVKCEADAEAKQEATKRKQEL